MDKDEEIKQLKMPVEQLDKQFKKTQSFRKHCERKPQIDNN